MCRLALAILVQLALLPAAFATARFDDPPVSPSAPIAGDEVEARVIQTVACAIPQITVASAGSLIELRYASPDDCSGGVRDILVEVPLGALPAGTYRLRLAQQYDAGQWLLEDETSFTVAVTASSCQGPQAGSGPAPDQGQPSLCLADGRFAVTAEWTSHDGSQGFGKPLPLTGESGAFWFFDNGNLELLVKVLDACGYNGRFWVYIAGLTDIGVAVRVREVATGIERTYTRLRGKLFVPVGDTNAFVCAQP